MKSPNIAFVVFDVLSNNSRSFWGDINLSAWSGLLKKRGIENDILLVLLHHGEKAKNIRIINQFIDYCKKYDYLFLRTSLPEQLVGKIKKIERKIYYLSSAVGREELQCISGSRGLGKNFCPNFSYKFFGVKYPLPQKFVSLLFNLECSYSNGIKNNYFYKTLNWGKKEKWRGCSYCNSAFIYKKILKEEKIKQIKIIKEQLIYLSKELPELEMVRLDPPDIFFDILPDLLTNNSLRPIRFYINLRPDILVKRKAKIERILKLMKKGKFSFYVANIGFENFSQRELEILNRGYESKINIEALKIFRFFGDKYPEQWLTSETRASFILFEPFATLKDILINANQIIKLTEYWKLFGEIHFNRLRISRDTPIYQLVKKAGLASDSLSTDVLSDLRGGFSTDNVEYKFEDWKVSLVYKFYKKFLSRDQTAVHKFSPVYNLVRSLNFLKATNII